MKEREKKYRKDTFSH